MERDRGAEQLSFSAMDYEQRDAIKGVMRAHALVLSELRGEWPALRALRDLTDKAHEIFAAEQDGKLRRSAVGPSVPPIGVSERTAQFLDRLLERVTDHPASREALSRDVASALAATDVHHARVREREREARERGDAAIPTDLRDDVKRAHDYQRWYDIETNPERRPLMAGVTTQALMAAVAVAAEREQQVPSILNRRSGMLIEEELDTRRREVALGRREITDLRPPPMTPEMRAEGHRTLQHVENTVAAPEVIKQRAAARSTDVEPER